MLKQEKSMMAIVFAKEFDNNYKVLLIKSKVGWEFPKGHSEENESEEETAVRECKEESGVDIKNATKLGLIDTFSYSFDALNLNMSKDKFINLFNADQVFKTINVYGFILPFIQPIVYSKSENFSDGLWVDINDVTLYLQHDNAKQAFMKALHILKKQTIN